LLAAEDVTGQPGFDFVIRSRSQDAYVSALPEESWFIQTQRNLGKPPEVGESGPSVRSFELPEGGGVVRLERSSFNPLLWLYYGPPSVPSFPSGAFIYALDAREKTIQEATDEAERGTPSCHNFTNPVGGNTTLVSCKPNLTPQQFADLYASTDPAFARTFVAM
jgi:hypothetical protein